MKSISITWTPAASSVEQEIVFRKVGDSSWTTFGVVAGSVNNATIDNLADDTTYEIRINSFCEGSGSGPSQIVTVSTVTIPVVTVVNNCGSSTLSTTATGTLLWSTGETTSSINVVAAGTYTVTRTVSGSTSAPGSGTANPKAIPLTPVINVVNNCNGTSTLSTVANGALLWSTNETTSTIIVTTAGTYTVTVTDNGCTSSPGSAVAAPKVTPPAPSVGVVNNCDGTSTLTATGYTGSLLWSTSATTPSITVSSAGVYTVTQTVDGCVSANGSGTANPKTTPSAPSVAVVDNCNGTSTLTASGYTGTLLWSTGDTTAVITVGSAGTYTVTQTVNGCTSPAGSGSASPKTTPSAPGVNVVDNCNGTSTLTATGYSGTLLWNTSETTGSIVVSSAGTYNVTQTVNGCTSAPGSGVASPKTTPATPVVTVVNYPGYSVLSTTAPGSLLWDTSETTSSITVTSAGSHCVTTTIDGCTSAPGCGTANPDPEECDPVTGVSATLGPDPI